MGTEKKADRRMPFWEICKGSFAKSVQAAFEQAQLDAKAFNAPVKIVPTIIVMPPDAQNPEYGGIGYKLSVVNPPLKSAMHTTMLTMEGLIVDDATDAASLLQLDMFAAAADNQVPFEQQGGAGE